MNFINPTIATNLTALRTVLEEALDWCKVAETDAAEGRQNAAVGALTPLSDLLADGQALHRTISIFNRQSA